MFANMRLPSDSIDSDVRDATVFGDEVKFKMFIKRDRKSHCVPEGSRGSYFSILLRVSSANRLHFGCTGNERESCVREIIS